MLTISITKEDSERLKQLAIRDGVKSRKEYLQLCISYFEKTGINPSLKEEDIISQIKKTESKLISFIKVQDQAAMKSDQRLQILIQDVNKIQASLVHFMSNIQKHL